MESKAAFSPSDLLAGAKKLKDTEVQESTESKTSRADTQEAYDNLIELYERHGGDLDAIFADLKADPTKAKKPHNRPKDKHVFADKYLQGFYDLVGDDESKDSRSESKK